MSPNDYLFLSVLGVSRTFVEQLVNQILRMDSKIGQRLTLLEGKLLAVEITELPHFFLLVSNGQVQLLWKINGCPDGTIRAGLFAAVQTMIQRNSHLLHDNSTYEVLGDPDTVCAVQKLFSDFEPDWEEQLSGIVGDAIARKVGQSARVAAKWADSSSRSAMQNISEYLQEERQVLVTRMRVERHLGKVVQLRQDVDVLEKRLALLGCLAE